MYSSDKKQNISETEDKIRRVGLRYLNLLQKNSFKSDNPKKPILKKRTNKSQLLFYISRPNYNYNSRIKYTPAKFNKSNTIYNSKNIKKYNSVQNNYLKIYKEKYFSKNLLLPKNLNLFTPKIKGFQLNDKSAYFKPSYNYYTPKIIKNSFSNNKATNASSIFNINFNLDKTISSIKSPKINISQIKDKNNKEGNKHYEEEQIKAEKNIFEKKLKRRKIKENCTENILYKNRKKYPFIRIPDYFKDLRNSNFPKNISFFNKKLKSFLFKENVGIFQHPINIIRKGKFSKKFENPRNIEIDEKKEEIYKIKDIRIGEFIPKPEEIKNEYDNKLDKKKNRKEILYKFKKKMIDIYLINENLILPMSEIIKKYKITNRIFNFDQTIHLNYFIKIKDLKSSLIALSANNNIVIDIDQFHMTPLHYAAKYNFYLIIPHLMNYGAYVDAKNSFNFTPLMFCLKKNFYESMLILFLYMANPFFEIGEGNNDSDGTINYNSKNILERIKLIHIKNRLLRENNYYKSVKNDIYNYIINECHNLIEPNCFNLIKTKL